MNVSSSREMHAIHILRRLVSFLVITCGNYLLTIDQDKA